MKKIFTTLFFLPFLAFSQVQEAEIGIRFEHTSFADLLAKAKKENKMVMVDAYTTWCGPCKWMVKNIFPNDTVGEFYNKNFVNAKIDMEKGEGIELAKKYQVSCYPTYLFIDGSGQLVHRVSSTMEAKKFIELGNNAMDPAKQFTSHQKKYDSGTATSEEIAEYILMRGRTCLPVKEELAKYFLSQAETDLIKKHNWDILSENSKSLDINSREFKYLVAHKAEFEGLHKRESVDAVVKNVYASCLNQCIKDKNSEKYNVVKAEVVKNNFSFGEEMILNADMKMYRSTKDWNNYALAAAKLVDNFKKDDFNVLNSIAWDFYENIEDKALLAKAEAWAKHSVELQPGYANMDTFAAVLFKLGKKPEALAAAEKAIELAKKSGDDYTSTLEMLDKIRALQ